MTSTVNFEFEASAIDNELLNRPHDVRVEDGRAYVVGKGGSFGIVDIEEMTVLGGLHDFDDAQVVCPVTTDRCYFGDRSGVHVVDVSDPGEPEVVGSVKHDFLSTFNGWDRWGPFLVGASKSGFLGAIRVDDPDNPSFAGGIDTQTTPGLRSPHDLRVVDGHAVVPDQHQHAGDVKLGVYRLAESGGDVEFESVAFRRETRLQGANRVVVKDGVGYVAANYSETVGVFEGVPTDPSLRAVLTAREGGGPNGLALDGDHLFVGTGSMIEAYDVSTPACPAIAGTITDRQQLRSTGSAHDMDVVDDSLFVTAQQSDRLVRYHLDR